VPAPDLCRRRRRAPEPKEWEASPHHTEVLRVVAREPAVEDRQWQRKPTRCSFSAQVDPTLERRPASHSYQIMAILILIVSSALLVFYLLATCQRILRREFGHK
jgi:hypothetical protein